MQIQRQERSIFCHFTKSEGPHGYRGTFYGYGVVCVARWRTRGVASGPLDDERGPFFRLPQKRL